MNKMLRITSQQKARVGGISVFDIFEVNLFPITFKMTHDLATNLMV